MSAYYAVIPANVRYDSRISANAKLLYGEITALCNEKGFCWATNGYFAKLYSVTARSIKAWISSLEEMGYITVNVRYKNDGKTVDNRCISINDKCDLASPVVKKTSPPREENFTTPGEENFPYNNIIYNNTSNKENNNIINNIITKESKKQTKHRYGEYKNVLLTDTEFDKLKKEYPTDYKDRIERLSCYIESTGRTYKNHLATIRNWDRMDKDRKKASEKPKRNYDMSIDEVYGIVGDEDE